MSGSVYHAVLDAGTQPSGAHLGSLLGRHGGASPWGAFLRCCAPPLLCGLTNGIGIGNIGGVVANGAFNEMLLGRAALLAPSAELLVSAMTFGSLFGNVLAGRAAYSLGRRACTMLALTFTLSGSLLPPLMWLRDIGGSWPLVLSRTLVGVGFGVIMVVAPTFSSELASAANRGAAESTFQLGIEVGILMAYILNWQLLPRFDYAWLLALCAQSVPALLALLIVGLAVPESPRWLAVFERRLEDAMLALRRVRTPEEDLAEELDGMCATLPESAEEWRWAALCSPQQRRVVALAVSMLAAQTLSGIDGIVAYAPALFEDITGSQDESTTLGFTVLVGAVFVVLSPLTVVCVDRFGRRPLLVAGSAGMSLSLTAVCVAQWTECVDEGGGSCLDGRTSVLVSVGGILLYCMFFSMSLGPIAWLVPTELVPSAVRAKTVSVGTLACSASALLVQSTYLSLGSALSESEPMAAVSAVYAVINALICAFIFLFVIAACARPFPPA